MQISEELKYKYYESSVQCVEADAEFIRKEYKRFYDKEPTRLREDFGGTGLLCCEWVRGSHECEAWSVDLDASPIRYGQAHHLTKLEEEAQKRVHYIEGNVLDNYDFRPEVTVAFNFSYFIFKKRAQMVEYFKKVHANLADSGLFLLDIFGGTDCYEPQEEETEYDGFSYFWDLDAFNPLTNECLYYIHFKDLKTGQKYKKAFTYDWRFWSVPEIVEILEEAGFSKVHTYWEGTDEDGEGDGNFYLSQDEENCESWVSYIAALK